MTKPKVRVMVADDNETRGRLLVQVLTDNGYDVVGLSGPGSYLPTQVADAEPDVVLVDTDSPSRDTLEQISSMQSRSPKPVVMFSSDEDRGTIESAVRAGVSAYIVDGLANAKVRPIIDVAIAHFERHESVRSELERTRTHLEERKTIDRAKGIIMERRACDEQAAFAILRKTAMDQKKRIGQVARDLVHMAGLLEAPATKEAGR